MTFWRSQYGRMIIYKYFQIKIMNSRILDEEKKFDCLSLHPYLSQLLQ